MRASSEEALSEIAKLRFELVHCETLAQALEFCSNSSPDAVLLDLGLPDAQGLETVRRMHAQPNRRLLSC